MRVSFESDSTPRKRNPFLSRQKLLKEATEREGRGVPRGGKCFVVVGDMAIKLWRGPRIPCVKHEFANAAELTLAA
jgi:hypothetical protein